MADKVLNLTMKQRLFVEAYFTCDYNMTEAAKMAGYNGNNLKQVGWELYNKPHIKAEIEKRAKEKLSEVAVSEEYVLRKLVKTIEKADQDDNPSAVLRGLELAARHLGMLRDRTEITGKDGEAIKYEEIANEADAFRRRISRIAKRGGEGEDTVVPFERSSG